jgi:hypothetical protein
MEHRSMQWFRFDGTSIEEIHSWMSHGAGVQGVTRAVENLEGMARDLKQSQESLRAALEEIGVGWEGTAGDSAGSSIGETETWSVAATPVVASSTDSTQSIGDDFAQTRNGMPTPQEAQLSTVEHVAAQSVPIFGPLVDRALADAKRDQVTSEARQRMNQWQASATASVESVQPLPPVPQPVVDVALTQAASAGAIGGTGSTGPVGSPSLTQVPVPPGGQPPAGGGSPLVPGPGRPPVSPGLPPVSPGLPQTPPGGPGPIAQPPVGQPGRAPSGPGLMPVPITGVGPGGTAPGRRRAFGPGMYSAEEIAKARSAAGTAAPKGAAGLKGAAEPGAAAGLKGQEAAGRAPAKGMAGAVAEGGPAGARGSAAGRGGGGLMQPAVGAGSRGEDDGEHSDKYADKTDEHFTEGIQRVVPPVIGG